MSIDSMVQAWETELFDRYNGERRSQEEIEADLYDQLGDDGFYDDPDTNYDRWREI